MNRMLVTLFAALPLFATDPARIEHDLDDIGRIATVMVDGDLCQRIVTPRAMQYIFRVDPRDQWADSDNYDVNDDAFIRTKKALIRLSHLVDYPVDVNLWLPLASNPPRIHIAIRNRYEMSQFWEWGKLTQPMFPEMRTVLETRKRVTVKQKPGFISVLAPVLNSLGDIAGLVEVVTRTQPDARENVK